MISDFYNDLDGKNKIYSAENEENIADDLFLKHTEQLSEYKFTFENQNNNYIFKSVEKVK